MPYSQFRAMLAITRASLLSQLKSPSAVVFGIAFPMIFIFVFGYLGKGTLRKYSVAITKESQTDNPVYLGLLSDTAFDVTTGLNADSCEELLTKKDVHAVISILPSSPGEPLLIKVRFNAVQGNTAGSIMSRIANLQNKDPGGIYEQGRKIAQIVPEVNTNRTIEAIDFVLPGQLGFSILSLAVFGTAFGFFFLRNTLVLKRFFATPIKRQYIILGEAISRLCFQVVTALIIITVGHYIFHFTLIHGLVTVINMLLVSSLGFLVFMGFGFVVSGVAKTEGTIPPFANLITLPQFLLSGTFFPIESFPGWMQPLCKILPLTHLNDALRNIAFDGYSIFQVWQPIGILLLWGVGIYYLASRVFRWE
jgi:ABC-2 type transport system permease protein